MIPLVKQNHDALAVLCRQYGVRRLDLFGSAATGNYDDATSDLDFVVDFAERSPGYAMRYLRFAEALETLLGRKVEVVTERSIRNPYFRHAVDTSRETVFGEASLPGMSSTVRRPDP